MITLAQALKNAMLLAGNVVLNERAYISSIEACTMIAVGKKATIDGSTLVAHTDDAGGGSADLRVVRVPAQDHDPDAHRSVYHFFQGYPRVVTNERGLHYRPHTTIENGKEILESLTVPLGSIPQVPHTYAYWDQDYGLMNEMQLSIAESTCGAKTVGWSKDVPNVGYNLFEIAELSKIALKRCDSACCAVQTMGDLAVEYGIFSEDSGDPARPSYGSSSEALGISDKYGEVWIFHILTGPGNSSAVWAAQRLEDTDVTVVANGFTIRELDLSDPDYCLASPNVHSFAEEMGWWSPEMGPFDFTAAYGSHTDPDLKGPLYVGRRTWRVFDLVAPSLKLDSRLGSVAEYATYPFSVTPDIPLTLTTLMDILRDYYEGTEYDLTKGMAAGPFGSPVRWGENKSVKGGWERAISLHRTIFSFVLQSRSNLPDHVGGVMWYGQSSPHHTVYIPISCAQETIPESYLKGKESKFDPDSAWWAFSFVNNWSLLRYDLMHKEIRIKVDELQAQALAFRQALEGKLLAMHHNGLEITQDIDVLTTESNAFAANVVQEWWQLAWQLISKFSDGYILTGEKTTDMVNPGYPKWWIEATEFPQWPGQTFIPRKSLKAQLGSSWARLNMTKDYVEAKDLPVANSEIEATSMQSQQMCDPILLLGIGMLLGITIGAILATFKLKGKKNLLHNPRRGYSAIT